MIRSAGPARQDVIDVQVPTAGDPGAGRAIVILALILCRTTAAATTREVVTGEHKRTQCGMFAVLNEVERRVRINDRMDGASGILPEPGRVRHAVPLFLYIFDFQFHMRTSGTKTLDIGRNPGHMRVERL